MSNFCSFISGMFGTPRPPCLWHFRCLCSLHENRRSLLLMVQVDHPTCTSVKFVHIPLVKRKLSWKYEWSVPQPHQCRTLSAPQSYHLRTVPIILSLFITTGTKGDSGDSGYSGSLVWAMKKRRTSAHNETIFLWYVVVQSQGRIGICNKFLPVNSKVRIQSSVDFRDHSVLVVAREQSVELRWHDFDLCRSLRMHDRISSGSPSVRKGSCVKH